MNKTHKEIKAKLIKAGVKNLKEFGYPHVNETNILSDGVYSRFFLGMLEDNKGMGFDVQIEELISEINR